MTVYKFKRNCPSFQFPKKIYTESLYKDSSQQDCVPSSPTLCHCELSNCLFESIRVLPYMYVVIWDKLECVPVFSLFVFVPIVSLKFVVSPGWLYSVTSTPFSWCTSMKIYDKCLPDQILRQFCSFSDFRPFITLQTLLYS